MKPVYKIVLTGLFGIIGIAFQNCGAGFKAQDNGSLNSLGDTPLGNGGPATPIQGPFTFKLSKADGTALPAGAVLEEGIPAKLTVTAPDISAGATAVFATDSGMGTGTPCVITPDAADKLSAQVVCSQDGHFNIRAVVTNPNGGAGIGALAQEVVIANMPVFRIPDNTGKNPWNTPNTAPVVFVGQTLRIYNDDKGTVHALHTGGTPCPHGDDKGFAFGLFQDCKIGSAYNFTLNSPMYDHLQGVNARFYATSIDGRALYTKNCASCHGTLANSTEINTHTSHIKDAILTVAEMRGLNLTDSEIRAIVFALKK